LVALSSGRPQAKITTKPPVSGTRGREHRGRESESDGRDQHAMSAESIGHRRQWKPAERGQSDNRESDAEFRTGEPGLVGDRRAVHEVAERSRHAAQRRHDAELAEARGERGDDRAEHDAVVPFV